MARAAITTLGCKVNQAESETLAAGFASLGFDVVPFASRADVYVVNSCSVTLEADHKSRRLARKALKTNPAALVLLGGCYVREGSRDPSLPAQIVLVPPSEKQSIPSLAVEHLKTASASSSPSKSGERTGAADFRWGIGSGAGGGRRSEKSDRTRRLVKIQDGCDNFCAYCVVPHRRGAPVSRPSREILSQVAGLASQGVAEIVLTGVNIGRYQEKDLRLPGLIRQILRGPIGRLRLSSIEPPDVDEQLIELLAGERLCPHLHVPLQSGSDAVLQRMGRRHDAARYDEICRRLRQVRPDLALTTDVMAGFPGETEQEADETIEFLKEVRPMKLHVFKYSPRPATAAASMTGQVDAHRKAERAGILAALDERLGQEFTAAHAGKDLDVLVETVRGSEASGLSGNYVRCYFKGDPSEKGTIVKVKGVRPRGRGLEAEKIGA